MTTIPAPSVAALHEAALSAHQAGRLEEAAAGYRAVIARQGDHADALNLLALAERERGNLDEAVSLSRRAVALFEHPTFLDNLGVILMDAGDEAAAEAAFKRGLELDPSHVMLLRDLGILYVGMKRIEEAAICNHRLLRVSPRDPQALSELGGMAHLRQRRLEAEHHYAEALAIDPNFKEAKLNLASLYLDTQRPEDAERLCREVLGSDPENRRARFSLAGALLAQERWPEAWPYFEVRDALPVAPPEQARRWMGEALAGQTILVLGEWGIGDHIQFARYAALLKARGARKVMFGAPTLLTRLLERVDGIDTVTHDMTKATEADLWAPLMTLPALFGATPETLKDSLPQGLPYIRLDRPRGPARRAKTAPLKVGIFWAGGHHDGPLDIARIDAQRSVDLTTVLPLMFAAELRGRIAWTILQKDRRPDYLTDMARTAGWTDPFAEDAPAPPADLLDTAEIIADLDLVIGVDSALIHLAAGQKIPTWMIDRGNHCWRWRPGREDSDWYPGMLRIFRQERLGDWDPVLARVRAALGEMARAGEKVGKTRRAAP
jgi:Flp pilus assembly protein TadD